MMLFNRKWELKINTRETKRKLSNSIRWSKWGWRRSDRGKRKPKRNRKSSRSIQKEFSLNNKWLSKERNKKWISRTSRGEKQWCSSKWLDNSRVNRRDWIKNARYPRSEKERRRFWSNKGESSCTKRDWLKSRGWISKTKGIGRRENMNSRRLKNKDKLKW